MLPMLVRVKMQDETRSFGFYLPMVLVYLLMIPVVILGAIVFAILLMIPEISERARSYLRLILALPGLLSACIGTEVVIQSETTDIVVRIV